MMSNTLNVQTVQTCLDAYMVKKGKLEINEIEANQELARTQILHDDLESPGKPLRELLIKLRDANRLPQNVRQFSGSWKIKHSKTIEKLITIFQF